VRLRNDRQAVLSGCSKSLAVLLASNFVPASN
jgi:hypothetical protein